MKGNFCALRIGCLIKTDSSFLFKELEAGFIAELR